MSELLPGIENRLKSVRDRFTQAIHEAHRSTDDVLLIAVGKTFPVDALEQVWALGQRHFGESGILRYEAPRGQTHLAFHWPLAIQQDALGRGTL